LTHKTVTLRKRTSHERGAAYVETDTPFSRSVTQIKELLDRYGCERILEYSNKCSDITEHSLAFECRGSKFLIEFPITYLQGKPPKLNMNVSGRIVYNKVKALLIDVDIEYLDFSQAMVPFMLLPTASGRPTTVTDIFTIGTVDERAKQVRFLLDDGGHR
jgi:hypothetical protein